MEFLLSLQRFSINIISKFNLFKNKKLFSKISFLVYIFENILKQIFRKLISIQIIFKILTIFKKSFLNFLKFLKRKVFQILLKKY